MLVVDIERSNGAVHGGCFSVSNVNGRMPNDAVRPGNNYLSLPLILPPLAASILLPQRRARAKKDTVANNLLTVAVFCTCPQVR